ncbi:MAG TPA: hypothetical protein VGJ57_03355 [Nitrospirales bacterium]
MQTVKKFPRCSVLYASSWIIAALCPLPVFALDTLPSYNADLSQTSVSGLSSGGYMAVQFHVAYSSTVIGAGVLAGGPYNCAKGSAWRATHNCMKPDSFNPVPDVKNLVTITDKLASAGDIDSTGNLANSKVWLFSGTKDTIVNQPVMDALQRYYQHYVSPTRIYYKHDLPAGHGMIVGDRTASACSLSESPYMNNCSYDAALNLLEHIYGSGNTPSSKLSGTFVQFDQKEFLDGDAYSHSMRDSGVAYIPASCISTRCKVHVAFHGCLQHIDAIGDEFYKKAGYNEWADTNNLIVLYPQTIARFGWNWKAFWTWKYIINPNACWDWWGYDDTNYYKKSGSQMTAIKKMLDRVGSPRM